MSKTLAPHPEKQRAARHALHCLFKNAPNVLVIHYNFYDHQLLNGRSPRITAIAIRNLETAQTRSFSIHQIAERKKFDFQNIEQQYDELERQMLDEFYAHIQERGNVKYLHWNMRDINYGFPAIEHRFQVLGGIPKIIDDREKFDLARLLIDIYGVTYVGHPRFEKLIDTNFITRLAFLDGKQEAKAFEERNFVGLHQSTLRKVDIIADIAERAYRKNLKTRTSSWQMHGGTIISGINWLANNKVAALILAIVGILVGIAGVLGLPLLVGLFNHPARAH